MAVVPPAVPRCERADGSRGLTLGERAAEDEILAASVDRGTGADEVEIPERVGRIAVKHAADDPGAGDDELPVGAETGIGEHDRFRTGGAEKVAGGKHVNAGHLEIRGV